MHCVMHASMTYISSNRNYNCTAFPVPKVTMTYTDASAFAVEYILTASPVTIRDSVAGCSASPEIRSPAGPEGVALPIS